MATGKRARAKSLGDPNSLLRVPSGSFPSVNFSTLTALDSNCNHGDWGVARAEVPAECVGGLDSIPSTADENNSLCLWSILEAGTV